MHNLKSKLIEFESRVAAEFEAGRIPGPIHLSGGNEDKLIEVFREISPEDWVFSTWRNHYHALLHGVPAEWLMAEIVAGRSMQIMYPPRRFFTSAIVGGILPIAVGAAAGSRNRGRKVWCFIGDMAATTGIFHESVQYAGRHDLPIQFVVEDNGLSCNTPTESVAEINHHPGWPVRGYKYARTWPHCGTGKWVTF